MNGAIVAFDALDVAAVTQASTIAARMRDEALASCPAVAAPILEHLVQRLPVQIESRAKILVRLFLVEALLQEVLKGRGNDHVVGGVVGHAEGSDLLSFGWTTFTAIFSLLRSVARPLLCDRGVIDQDRRRRLHSCRRRTDHMLRHHGVRHRQMIKVPALDDHRGSVVASCRALNPL